VNDRTKSSAQDHVYDFRSYVFLTRPGPTFVSGNNTSFIRGNAAANNTNNAEIAYYGRTIITTITIKRDIHTCTALTDAHRSYSITVSINNIIIIYIVRRDREKKGVAVLRFPLITALSADRATRDNNNIYVLRLSGAIMTIAIVVNPVPVKIDLWGYAVTHGRGTIRSP